MTKTSLMKIAMTLLVATAAQAMMTSRAEAAYAYSLRMVASPTAPAPGGNVSVSLFLDELKDAADPTRLSNDGGGGLPIGLTSGNFQLALSGAGNGVFLTGLDAFNNPYNQGNSDFDSVPVVTESSNLVTVSQYDVNPFPTPLGTQLSPTQASLLLGVFTVQAGTTGSNTLTVLDFDPILDDLTLGDATVLDSIFASAPTLTITAVPEPTSIATMSVLGLAGVWYRRRKAQRAKAAAAVQPVA